MNTYRIYEELRGTLGEEAAKSLAHTFGPLFEEIANNVTKEDLQELKASIEARSAAFEASFMGAFLKLTEAQDRTEAKVSDLVDAQERLTEAQMRTESKVSELADAQARTESKVSELADAQARTEAKVSELADAQARTEAKVSELADAQARTEAKVSELADAQVRTEAKMTELSAGQSRLDTAFAGLAEAQRSLTSTVERLSTRTDSIGGWAFELRFRERFAGYLGRFLRRSRILRNDEVIDSIESRVEPDEADDLMRADVIASGQVDGQPTHVVVEVSVTGDREDIERAERRAGILRKAGMAAIPFVACEVISPKSLAFAHARQVKVWCSGSLLEAA